MITIGLTGGIASGKTTITNFIQILKENEIDYQSVQRKLQIEALWNRLIFQKYSKNLVINVKT